MSSINRPNQKRSLFVPESGWYAYALIDKRNGKVFYIGITNRPIEERYKEHISCIGNNWRKNEYIQELLAEGIEPIMLPFHHFGDISRQEAEIEEGKFVKLMLELGQPLTNDQHTYYRRANQETADKQKLKIGRVVRPLKEWLPLQIGDEIKKVPFDAEELEILANAIKSVQELQQIIAANRDEWRDLRSELSFADPVVIVNSRRGTFDWMRAVAKTIDDIMNQQFRVVDKRMAILEKVRDDVDPFVRDSGIQFGSSI